MNKVSSVNHNVTFFDPTDYFCNRSSCFYQIQGSKLLYKDDNHLNINGGRYVGKFFDF
jgi:hypothetical protein